jgi:hypothetical protein
MHALNMYGAMIYYSMLLMMLLMLMLLILMLGLSSRVEEEDRYVKE